VCIDNLSGQVYNGGFSQYFFNGYGGEWKIALDGLHAIGAKKHAEVFSQVIDKFGPTPLPEDYEECQDLLEEIMNQDEEMFYELEEVWFRGTGENLNALIFKYAKIVRNLEDDSNRTT
jgi:hypothetical protein